MKSKGAGLLAIIIAAAVLWAIPTASSGKTVDLRKTGDALRQVTDGLAATVDETLAKTQEELRQARERAKALAAAKRKQTEAGKRATATDPATQPPLHGTNPHAQGGVAVADLNPSNERPLGSKPDGTDAGEDAIVGRARGEKNGAAYHGHITILTLLGQELAGVDSAPGETKNGPLQPVQTGILDPLCTSTNGATCLSVLVANSTTTATGSDNDFAVARASVLGIGVGAAESHGTIGEDATCQAATGSSRVANVTSPGGGAVANAVDSTSTSKSCNDGSAPVVTNTSHVIGLGGAQVPIPAAGCANGTPDTLTGIPAVLPIVCNADDIAGAAAVREALDVFALQVGSTSVLKATTGSSEALSVAPPKAAPPEKTKAQCEDGKDNDGDGKIDAKDPGCHVGGTLQGAYNAKDDDESDDDTGGSSGTQCSDKRDNDGDGKIDAADPGCHENNDINQPYNPDDDSEASDKGNGNGGGGGNAPTGGQNANDESLPFTGSDVVGLTLAGLLMLAGGLLLRRREDTHAAL